MDARSAMAHKAQHGPRSGRARVLAKAPEELTRGPLLRLGEGIGKVVYASEHWVVKRERHPSEIMALIFMWKALRRLQRLLPHWLAQGLPEKPGRPARLLRVLLQGVVLAVPRGVWWATSMGRVWRWYAKNEVRGALLADEYLVGTRLIPDCVCFPPKKVQVDRWPGWLLVDEAAERVEMTLADRINELARARQFDEIGEWLERFLELRQAGWRRGVFSLDHHLKNYGVMGERVVLLDTGGLTNRWSDIEERLGLEHEFLSPHAGLGLEMTLRDRPDIAEWFDARWRATVNLASVRSLWPGETARGVPRA
jgi:hypothetical protein